MLYLSFAKEVFFIFMNNTYGCKSDCFLINSYILVVYLFGHVSKYKGEIK